MGEDMRGTIVFLITVIITSVCLSQTVPRNQSIVAGEFFVGPDPGEGKGSPIVATYGSSTVDVSFGLSIAPGTTAFLRFKSSAGRWSAPQAIKVDALTGSGASLVGGEYFINKDPGVGKGNALQFTINNNLSLPNLSLKRG
ncbi:MAG: hypothetical protein ACP5US_11320, partial [Candidatus Kryptoniota bacterium]